MGRVAKVQQPRQTTTTKLVQTMSNEKWGPRKTTRTKRQQWCSLSSGRLVPVPRCLGQVGVETRRSHKIHQPTANNCHLRIPLCIIFVIIVITFIMFICSH